MNKKNLENLMKFELHVHIEGTIYPEFLIEKAKENKIKIDFETAEEYYEDYKKRDSLQKFLNAYYGNMRVLCKEKDFYDLAVVHAKRAASQNIKYSEIFFDPQPHLYRGVKLDEIIDGLYSGFKEAEKKYNFKAQLIMCFLKDLPESEAEEVLLLARNAINENKIIGIGFDSNESPNWVQRFQKIVLKARFLGLKIVTHCQENKLDQSGREVLHFLQPNRIDHGYFLHEDKELIEKIKQDNINITMCPYWSTTGDRFSNKKEYPLKKYLDLGVSISINSDDPAYHGANLAKTYDYVQDTWNLTKEEWKKITLDSINATFLKKEEKVKYLKEAEDYFNNSWID